MKHGFLRMVAGLMLAGFAVGGALSAFAPPVKRGPSIKFSEPQSETVTTNLNALAEEKRNNLRRLEEDLTRSFRVLGRDDIGGAQRMLTRPLTGPVISSKEARELRDREKNWVFVDPEELPAGLTLEEMMGVTEYDEAGREKTETTVLDRYLESLSREIARATNGTGGDVGAAREDDPVYGEDWQADDAAADPNVAKVAEAEKGLRRSSRPDPGLKLLPDLGDTSSMMPDLFDAPSTKTTTARAQESRLNQLRQMIPTDLPTPQASPLSTLSPFPALSTGGTTLGSGYPGSVLSGLNTLGGGGSVARPSATMLPPPTSLGAASLSGVGMATTPSWSAPSKLAVAPPPISRPSVVPSFLDGSKRKF